MNAYIPSKITPEKCSSDGIGTQMVGVGETKQGMSVFESKVFHLGSLISEKYSFVS